MPTQPATRSTAAAELSAAHCDAILRHLKYAGRPQTLVEIRDAIDADSTETLIAIQRLSATGLIALELGWLDCTTGAYHPSTYTLTRAAVLA